MWLKRILPIEMNYFIKHFIQFINQKRPEFSENAIVEKKRVFFLDTPAYGNLGDQAIALAMRQFVREVLPDHSQFEIQEDILPHYIGWLKKNIRKKDIIILTGGGNMGVTYQRYEAVRRLVIRNFRDNKIFIFPQTFDYGVSYYGKKEKKRAKRLYDSAPNLILSAREQLSYDRMRETFEKCRILLCPDIVLYLDYMDWGRHDKSVGICIRKDLESALKPEAVENIQKNFADSESLETGIGDEFRITEKNRKELVEKKIDEFAERKLIITDRLHGMIFAYISNTPCIAFPNTNRKIEFVYKWIEGKGNIIYSDDFNINLQPQNTHLKNTKITKEFDMIRRELLYLAQR